MMAAPLKELTIPLRLTLTNNHAYNFSAVVRPGTCSVSGFEVPTAELLHLINDLKKAIMEVLS